MQKSSSVGDCSIHIPKSMKAAVPFHFHPGHRITVNIVDDHLEVRGDDNGDHRVAWEWGIHFRQGYRDKLPFTPKSVVVLNLRDDGVLEVRKRVELAPTAEPELLAAPVIQTS